MKETKKNPGKKSSSKHEGTRGLVPVELFRAQGSELSRLLLKYPETREAVQSLSKQDYFWIIKKAGQDSLSLLALGSEEQWRYLLDIDLWERDRIDRDRLTLWMERFGDADPERFVEWLFLEGLSLTCLYFFEMLDILTLTPDDEDAEIPEGFFTFDGVVYMRPRDEASRDALQVILDTMARMDIHRFNWIVMSLGGLIPAETEEDLYRRKNARLADEGFLPFEEALELYVPLDADSLESWDGPGVIDIPDDDREPPAAPGLPLAQAGRASLFMEAVDRAAPGADIDRLRFEFAGLCNQVLSAGGTGGRELDELVGAAEKSGGYINMALETLAGDSPEGAEKTIRSHPLQSLFRVGFGLVTKVAREAQAWHRASWFLREGLPLSFLGEDSEKLLQGLLSRRPRYYAGAEGFRDFSGVQDLESCRSALERLARLDELACRLDALHPMDRALLHSPGMSIQPLLITFFARKLTGTPGNPYGISLDEARGFLDLIRRGESGPPYAMSRHEESFLAVFEGLPAPERTGDQALRDALAATWKEFRDEYEHVESADLKARYAKYFIIFIPNP